MFDIKLIRENREAVQKNLAAMHYDTIVAVNTAQALQSVQDRSFDIALLDYALPDQNGIQAMQRLKEVNPNAIFIIMTGYGSIDLAVEAMQAGAWDFLTKPLSRTILKEKLEHIAEFTLLRKEQNVRAKAKAHDFKFNGVIGPSAAMHNVYEEILRAAQSDLPVLVEGDTGAGKELILEAIHQNSRRADKPFVVMDCTATPETLVESILFGSAKGAFTGSVERKGLLEEADGGSLFLDEIGELSEEIQPKLLRCLETGRFRPVGKTSEVTSNFRILCATNRNLKDAVIRGEFRSDLYYRISAQTILAPPLLHRLDDLPALASHFLQQVAERNEVPPVELTPAALHKLDLCSWPGNIRQLKYVIEAAFFNRRTDRIDADDVRLDERDGALLAPAPAAPIVDLDIEFKPYREKAVLEAEKVYLRALLQKTNGDVRQAAEIAGMTREAFYRVMNRCRISPRDFRP